MHACVQIIKGVIVAMPVALLALAAALEAPASLPRFVGYAYKEVNASASHNIVVMATVAAAPYT